MLLQHAIQCEAIPPHFCTNGWVPVYIRLRFCTGVESRYEVLQVGLLGLVLDMEKTKFWLVGYPHLVIFNNHKTLEGLVKTLNFDWYWNTPSSISWLASVSTMFNARRTRSGMLYQTTHWHSGQSWHMEGSSCQTRRRFWLHWN